MSVHGPTERASIVVSSGATYPGVPTTTPLNVATPAGRATPKSAILNISPSPRPQHSTFSGFKSRWMTPTSCTAMSPLERHSIAFAARFASKA